MSDEFSIVEVETGPETVSRFIRENRERYLNHLREVRTLVASGLRDVSVYKIYGRDDRQEGEPLKDPRKVRLKFNRYNKREGNSVGSLWDTPDIVGFTIVVAYPSQISAVCSVIDGLVSQGLFLSENPPAPQDSTTDDEIIRTIHGRAFKKKGYVACHYNLREKGVDSKVTPICEIQIKTILFDAWGAKTHDLTYKPSAPVDETLVRGFEILGDTLALVDLQSDSMRMAIERQNSVRHYHLQQYLTFKARNLLQQAMQELDGFDVEALQRPVDPAITIEGWNEIFDCALKIFGMDDPDEEDLPECKRIKRNKKWASVALFAKALHTQKASHINKARELFIEWIKRVEDDVAKLHAFGISGMVNLFANDPLEAISETQRGIDHASILEIDENDEVRSKTFQNVVSSIHSSQSYYYALLVGSHVGHEVDATSRAKKEYEEYLQKCAADERSVHDLVFDQDRLMSIFEGHHESRKNSLFMALDNGIFVRTQTTTNLDEMKSLRTALDVVHKLAPPTIESEARLLFELHDYCARTRLSELEGRHLGSSQS